MWLLLLIMWLWDEVHRNSGRDARKSGSQQQYFSKYLFQAVALSFVILKPINSGMNFIIELVVIPHLAQW